MALTKEDLQAIAALIDEKLQPVNKKLDLLELGQKRTSQKLDDLQLDVKLAEREIRRDIRDLNDEMETVIEVMKMNELIPR